jgi:hypothetical protein
MIKDLRAQGDLYLDGKPVLRTGVLFGKTPKGMERRSNAKIFARRGTRVGE